MKVDIQSTINDFENCQTGASQSDRSTLLHHLHSLSDIQQQLDESKPLKCSLSEMYDSICSEWIDDDQIFDKILVSWKRFQDEYALYIKNISLTDRLNQFGLLKAYEKHIADIIQLDKILRSILMDST